MTTEALMDNVIPTEGSPSITWLNATGDVTISWEESNREKVLELVLSKMKEGYSFFVVKPRMLGIFGNKKVPLTHESQLKGAVGVVVPDSLVDAIVGNFGDAEVTR